MVAGGGSAAAAQVQAPFVPVAASVVAPATTGTDSPAPATLGAPVSLLPSAVAATWSAPSPAATFLPTAIAALVAANVDGVALDEQARCLATAIYFESRGEPVEGQLAVADVVLNRAASGRYPTAWCGVVRQRAQFSFVRGGRFPHINAGCDAWRRAQAVARVASQGLAHVLPAGTLWYHANYVAPRWRDRLVMVQQIGAHLFYRS